MYFAGIDVGAQSVKAVIFDGSKIIGWKVYITEEEADKAAKNVYDELLEELGILPDEVTRIVATGWGAGEISFAHKKSSEQVCSAKGARLLFNTARTIVDIGAEGCRAIRLDSGGNMEEFANNDRCASGTGSFIELGAIYLRTPIEDMGQLSLSANGFAEISSTCAVFAESVIISNIHKGEPPERIAAGIHRAAAIKIVELIGRIGLNEDLVITGGAALNQGLIKILEEMTGTRALIPENPRIVAALGAAIQAFRQNRKTKK
jgi:predicted CoA-substrate-specific enzyme activase